jgi:hypothetical protein
MTKLSFSFFAVLACKTKAQRSQFQQCEKLVLGGSLFRGTGAASSWNGGDVSFWHSKKSEPNCFYLLPSLYYSELCFEVSLQ